jgi:hypothetical protein
MTTHTLRQWGAVLLTGGLFMTVAYLFFPSTAHSSLMRPCASLALVGVLLALPALVVYQRGQSSRATVNGWIGTSITILALAMLEIPHLVLGTFSPSSLYDLDAYHSGLWGTVEFGGLMLLPIGLIVLAVATWRSGTYPRWAGWTFIISVVLAMVGGFVGPLGTAIRTPAPNYLLMSTLGLAMILVARDRADSYSPTAADSGIADPVPSTVL